MALQQGIGNLAMSDSHDNDFLPCTDDKFSPPGDTSPPQALSTPFTQEDGADPRPSDTTSPDEASNTSPNQGDGVGSPHSEADKEANIRYYLNIMRCLEIDPQFAEKLEFYREQILKILETVTCKHLKVNEFLKERLTQRVGSEPQKVDFDFAAHLARLNLKKYVTVSSELVTLIPAADWIAVPPDLDYFVVHEGGAWVLYHKFYNPKK